MDFDKKGPGALMVKFLFTKDKLVLTKYKTGTK